MARPGTADLHKSARARRHAEKVLHVADDADVERFALLRKKRNDMLRGYRKTPQWKRFVLLKKLERKLKMGTGRAEWN